jgi:starvation-inducible DNA-binding protein
MNDKAAASRRTAKLATPTSLGKDARRDISGALNALLADFFALYLKTKNFHWHVSGPHFRDYHLLLDEQADQIYATTDPIAERVRKLGGTTCGRSATSRGCSAWPTTTRNS